MTETKTRAFYLTVCSGKGGVGKSTTAVILAAKLAESGYRTLLLDADTGLGDLAVMTNAVVRCGFERVLAGEADLNAAVTKIAPSLWLIGTEAGATRDLVMLNERGLHTCRELDALFDAVILDTSSSLDALTLSLMAYSDLSVVVTTPRIPAVADAYTQLKQALQLNPRLTAAFVVNRVESEPEGLQAAAKFTELVEKFLQTAVAPLGIIEESPLPGQFAETHALVALSGAGNPAVRKLDKLTKTLRENHITSPRRASALWNALADANSLKTAIDSDDTGLIAQALTIKRSK